MARWNRGVLEQDNSHSQESITASKTTSSSQNQFRTAPILYAGGESPLRKNFIAQVRTLYLITDPLNARVKKIADLRQRARANTIPSSLNSASRATLIVRERKKNPRTEVRRNHGFPTIRPPVTPTTNNGSPANATRQPCPSKTTLLPALQPRLRAPANSVVHCWTSRRERLTNCRNERLGHRPSSVLLSIQPPTRKKWNALPSSVHRAAKFHRSRFSRQNCGD